MEGLRWRRTLSVDVLMYITFLLKPWDIRALTRPGSISNMTENLGRIGGEQRCFPPNY